MNVVVVILALSQIITLHLYSKELDKLKMRLQALETPTPTEKEGDDPCGL